MGLTFYYGSGSPFGWRIWLSLEHKGIPYDLRLLSFDAGDHKKPEYLAVNPRGQIPAIVHDGFALFESSVICAYLDDVWRDRPLLPETPRERAVARRLAAEIDGPFHATQRRLLLETLYRRGGLGDPTVITEALAAHAAELGRFEAYLTADYLAGGSVTLADYTFYPFIANLMRLEQRYPHLAAWSHVGPRIRAWAKRIEALPHFEKTTPPHWKE